MNGVTVAFTFYAGGRGYEFSTVRRKEKKQNIVLRVCVEEDICGGGTVRGVE